MFVGGKVVPVTVSSSTRNSLSPALPSGRLCVRWMTGTDAVHCQRQFMRFAVDEGGRFCVCQRQRNSTAWDQ